MEHGVIHLGHEPASKGEYRIRCECGWTEKYRPWHFATNHMAAEQARITLMLRWERHVYTPEELLVMHELEGCEVCNDGIS